VALKRDSAPPQVDGGISVNRLVVLVCLLLAFAFPLSSQPPAFQFLTRTDFQINEASQIVVGDFNGDGIMDLAASQYVGASGPNGVEIFLGDANHEFRNTFFLPLTYGGGNLTVADINGDGKLDLVAVNGFGSVVLWGQGDGTFTVGPSISVGGAVSAIAADFNGDGKIDLALSLSTGIDILLGHGDGTFTSSQTISIQDNACLAVGDFNGDGKPDVVGCPFNEVDVFLGHGDGTFSSALASSTPSQAVFLAVGDMNNDGKLDLVGQAIYENGTNQNLGPVYVLYGKGDGTFEPTLQVHSDVGPLLSLGIGDLDGDGHLDIVAEGIYGLVAVLHNNGHGHFSRQAAYPVTYDSGFFESIAVVKLAKDPLPSIVASNSAGQFFSILLNSGKGKFPDVKSFEIRSFFSPVFGPYGTLAGLAQADFNGDGIPDLAIPLAQGHPWQKELVRVLFGTGKASTPFVTGPDTAFSSISEVSCLIAGDFNGDGKQDLAISFSTALPPYVQILLGDGAGGFSKGPSFVSPGGIDPASMEAVDVNGDGKLDLILSSGYVLLGNGDGSFGKPLQFYNAPGDPGLWVQTADFNHDGKLDLAYLLSYDSLHEQLMIFLGNGDGTFQKPTAYPLVGEHEWGQVADFNGDGIPDVAVLFLGATDDFTDQVAVYLGKGDGTLAQPTYLNSFPLVHAAFMLAGDFNGDGRTDLAVMDEYSALVEIFAGDGDGSFAPPVEFGVGEFPAWMMMGNYHGQKRPGFLDLATLSSAGSFFPVGSDAISVSVLLNQGH